MATDRSSFTATRKRHMALRSAIELMPMHMLLAAWLVGAWWFASRGAWLGAATAALLALVTALQLALALAATFSRRQP